MMTKKKTRINKTMDYRLKAIYEQMLLGEKKGEKKPILYYALLELNFVTQEGHPISNPQDLDVKHIYVTVPENSQPASLPVDEEDSQEVIEPKMVFAGDSESQKRRLKRLIEKFVNVSRENWPKITNPYFYFKAARDSQILPLKNLIKNFGYPAASRINQGHAAEGILGAALYCRFRDPQKEVSLEDIVVVLEEVLSSKKHKIQGKTSYVKQDDITFLLKLDERTTTLLRILSRKIIENKSFDFTEDFIAKYNFDKENLSSIVYLFQACANYVNTDSRVAEKVKKVSEDNISGLLEVESTGGDATTQSTTKVDLYTKYTTTTNSEENKENLLSLSMKAGKVSQFGQVSGGAFVKYKTMFAGMFGEEFFNQLTPPSQTNLKFYKSGEDTEKSPWIIPAPEGMSEKEIKEYNFIEPLKYLYTQVANNFNRIFASTASAAQKTQLIENIYMGIRNHATLDIDLAARPDPEVTLLILNPNDNKNMPPEKRKDAYSKYYTELSFGTSLIEQLKSYAFEAKPEFSSDNKTRLIKLMAKPISVAEARTLTQAYNFVTEKVSAVKQKKLTGNNLFLLQLRSNLANFRNRIEMGPFLKELALIQKAAANSLPKAQ